MDSVEKRIADKLGFAIRTDDFPGKGVVCIGSHTGPATKYATTEELKLWDALLASERRQEFSFRDHLNRQREFSERTFGPNTRTMGIIDHIRKELREIESDPHDVDEWIDSAILSLDGAWRCLKFGIGLADEEIADIIISRLVGKQDRNEKRDWPDWRTAEPDKAIEHVRQPLPPVPSEEESNGA